MDKSNFQYFWLILFCICFISISYTQGIFMKFTNITCESKDDTFLTVEYCYMRQVDRLKNSISLRLTLLQPIDDEYKFKGRFMINNNGWKPFLYSVNIEMCSFWKKQHNALAKLFLGFTKGHSNMNHSCPYYEKYLTFDNIVNTDISKNLQGIPLGKGHYAVYTTWSCKNATRAHVNIYFEVVNYYFNF